MIDIETRRVIDILESRETEDVARWLASYPNIRVVSRDGSLMYAAAIRKAHPNAIQVSDRFHLVKNLTDAAKQHITKIVGANFRIPAAEGASGAGGEYFKKAGHHGADLPERHHTASTEKKRSVVKNVHRLAAQGATASNIAKELGIDRATVRKYMNEDFEPSNGDYGNKKPGKLNPYTEKINAMLCQRRTFREIETAIREAGYDGASSTIRMYATRQRKLAKTALENATGNIELIEQRWVTKLLYQPIEKIKGITESQLERIVVEYPVVGVLYDIVRSFKEMMFAKRFNEIDSWIADARSHGIDEITGFINGVSGDLDAVKNAVRFEYNNGLAEGSVNKLKVIKRIMYGRNSFKLLRSKLLLLEANRYCN
jgi:DNA-binding CsgD family transcriptional regulator